MSVADLSSQPPPSTAPSSPTALASPTPQRPADIPPLPGGQVDCVKTRLMQVAGVMARDLSGPMAMLLKLYLPRLAAQPSSQLVKEMHRAAEYFGYILAAPDATDHLP